METILDAGVVQHCEEVGAVLRQGLEALAERFDFIREVRGKGLLLGVEMDRECGPMVQECMREGLLVVLAGPNVLRMVPPLTIEKAEVDEALGILERVLGRA